MLEQLQLIRWHIIKSSKDPQARLLYYHLLQKDKTGHVGSGRKSTPRLKLEELERQVDLETRISSNAGQTGLGFYRTLKVKNAKDKRSQILTALKD